MRRMFFFDTFNYTSWHPGGDRYLNPPETDYGCERSCAKGLTAGVERFDIISSIIPPY
ncbi:hypothetical protein HYPSUDRAFT_36727 [Hypholoma sublateritium FD-334 SS-4]|uniref:Uncharacterized protein n=1 Tax=Hypholoma sublateritium (strain FD-334 SS-4) TaxID=945553 RepID=A0A0D2Q467_HYPSF|nr:hypothetical protein HYPSUDRAFT_36727 [Hypholoma sublateritium FD-334 SS-4]